MEHVLNQDKYVNGSLRANEVDVSVSQAGSKVCSLSADGIAQHKNVHFRFGILFIVAVIPEAINSSEVLQIAHRCGKTLSLELVHRSLCSRT